MLSEKELRDVARIGTELTSEKDKNLLFERLLNTAMDISGCDAGTLYQFRQGKLFFKIMKTLSQNVNRGAHGEDIDLPPVELKEENVCAFSAIRRELVNIPDVYTSDHFDFSGPRRYDAMTGYRTGSMLVIPLEDAEGKLIGVLQLINKLGEDGFISFTEEDEFILKSLGSMAAVTLSNMLYIEEIQAQMFSFVQAFAAAVDERTPYNGSHTRKVTVYTELLARYINRLHQEGKTEEFFDDDRREQMVLSAALHDIGKMIVPLTVMNKATRLEGKLPLIEERFRRLGVLLERDYLKGCLTAETYEKEKAELEDALALVRSGDAAGFLPNETLDKIRAIAKKQYTGPDGEVIPWLTPEEEKNLLVQKGTLTPEERQIMENHALMTGRILEKVRFSEKYKDVKRFAEHHHEYLNGSGYPDHLTAEELPLEIRILTAADVFDALTGTDRPYKKPMPRERAFAILKEMAGDGQVDAQVVAWLEEMLADMSQEDIDTAAAADEWFR